MIELIIRYFNNIQPSYIILGEVVMENVIKEKLEVIVALMNDPEVTVSGKEIKEKVEAVVALLDHPEAIAMQKKENKEKLEKVVVLLDNAMVDPDIDIDYYIPGTKITVETSDTSEDPYVLVTYVVGDYNKPTRKIHLGNTIMHGIAEEIANQVTFSIEEFKGEIDSVEMG